MHEKDMSRWLLKILNNAGFVPKIYNVGSNKQLIIKNFFAKMSRWHKFDCVFNAKKCLYIDDYYYPEESDKDEEESPRVIILDIWYE